MLPLISDREFIKKQAEVNEEENDAFRLYLKGLDSDELDKKDEENYQQGVSRIQPVGIFYNRFGRYYSTIYDRVYQPGYYTTSTDYFLESNLYDIASGNLLYSVQTKSFDPSSATALASDNSKKIVKDLKEKGVLVQK